MKVMKSILPWIAAAAMVAVQWAPLPGSAFIVTALIRVPAVRAFLPRRALQLIEAADMVAWALRAVRFLRARIA